MSFQIDGTNGGFFPSWTTATRPASPVAGQVGFNSTLGSHESYNGTSWQQFTNAPAFSAYLSANQNITSSTATKIAFNTKEFDTANAFDAVTNYRFTPQVAGYYQFNCTCVNSGTSITNNWLRIYKNGSAYSSGIGGGVSTGYLNASDLIYLNGSTDYVEVYGFITATSPAFVGGTAPTLTKVTGSMVRAA